MSTFACCIYLRDAVLHREVKAAAAMAGMTMAKFADQALRKAVSPAADPAALLASYERRATRGQVAPAKMNPRRR